MIVTAVVPAWNEAEDIGPLVTSLGRYCDNVIVANRPGTDDTQRRARSAGAHVINVDEDGLGPAYLAAWRLIPDDEHVLHIDCGHDPIFVPQLLDVAADTFADVTIGSRFCPGGAHLSRFRRRMLTRVAAGVMNVTTATQIADWTSGYRVYSPDARFRLARIDYATVGHAWQIETLWNVLHAGMKVRESPIIYLEGKSSANLKRTVEAARLAWDLSWL